MDSKQRIPVTIGSDFPTRELSLEQALGVATRLHREGRAERAAAAYESILRVLPAQFDALHLSGVLLLQRGDPGAAVRRLRAALEVDDNSADAHCHLGQALRRGGDQAGARRALERALELEPGLAQAHNAVGALWLEQDQPDRAADAYRRAIEAAPRLAGAHANLAAALIRLGAAREAEVRARQALEIEPRLGPAHKCLGVALSLLGQSKEARSALEQAVRHDRDDPDAHYQLGVVEDELGHWDQALRCHQRALEIDPDFGPALSETLFLRRRLCRWDEHRELLDRFISALDAGGEGLKPFSFLSEESGPARQQQCARVWAAQIERRCQPLPPRRLTENPERITIGYLSSGFHRHPTACLTAEFFEHHDRGRFRTIAYSVGPDDGSALRRRLESAFDQFRHLQGRAFEAIAESVRADRVDILVDLRGYGGGAVSEVLAMRPAPLQVNWLAYPGTMGADFIDYIVVDPFVAPPEVVAHLDEQPVFLPHSYQPTDTTRDFSAIELSRAGCGLPDEGMIYCSFNNSYKFSKTLFAVWMRILNAVPDSVLWLLAGKAGTSTDANLRAHAKAQGVDPRRLKFMTKRPHLEYLARYTVADLFLDTLPYNAHTTASDALWAGCPVLTCPGETFASRVAGSLVGSAGAPELAVDSLDEYEATAIRLGQDQRARAALRLKLADARAEAPLFQTGAFCAAMEQAYETMYERAAAGRELLGFAIPP